jgi:hypothetical protein
MNRQYSRNKSIGRRKISVNDMRDRFMDYVVEMKSAYIIKD